MKIEKIAQKFLAGTLSVMMVFSSVPVSTFAQEVTPDSGEATPEPTAEVVQEQPTETETPAEQPAVVQQEETPEPTPTP